MWDIHPTIWVASVVNYVSESNPDDALREIDDLNFEDPTRSVWPELITWDVSANWQHTEHWPSFTFSVENLFNDQVKEYPEQFSPFANGTQYYLDISWNFT